MQAIFRREIGAYFKSPLGYIFLAIFYFFGGQAFSTLIYAQANMIAYVFSSLFTIVLFLTPLLTMRLLSEDKKQKTDQVLLTAPISLNGIVWGKYLAACMLFIIGIACTAVYFLVLASFATPEWYMFLGNLLAIFLLGAAMISIGLFISALTESQMVAAIGAFATMFLIMMIDSLAALIPVPLIQQVLGQISFMSRYSDFTSGILDFKNVIFFISVIVVFNFLTVRVLEKRRWS